MATRIGRNPTSKSLVTLATTAVGSLLRRIIQLPHAHLFTSPFYSVKWARTKITAAVAFFFFISSLSSGG